MGITKSTRLFFRALFELDPRQLWFFSGYQLGLRCSYYRWRTPIKKINLDNLGDDENLEHYRIETSLFHLPERKTLSDLLGKNGRAELIAEAEDVVEGRVKLFGVLPVTIDLSQNGRPKHWTKYKIGKGRVGDRDIKWIWEQGRLGWVFTLARAYHLTGDERYPQTFQEYFRKFLVNVPINSGAAWASAQEVALRLIALVYAAQVFKPSESIDDRFRSLLGKVVAMHAARLPLTLAYARAQNNNHLLTEAAGLYTAGIVLHEHPKAGSWRSLGWRMFNQGIQTQVSEDGVYVQHSTNYHRLMLQIALWMRMLARMRNCSFPEDTEKKLIIATEWLLDLRDDSGGYVPNLGPNDGANILPLSICEFYDYRPILQAASSAFLGAKTFIDGHWNELALWLVGDSLNSKSRNKPNKDLERKSLSFRKTSGFVLRTQDYWAYLRAANFTSRPGHADQLHLDIWWRGMNIAQDPGTFSYNDEPPWNNSLSRTDVHNTITVDDNDQMTWAGRFLWLDWAQSKVLHKRKSQNGKEIDVAVQHDGYRNIGVIHTRSVQCQPESIMVVDDLFPSGIVKSHPEVRKIRLHWLLPDWEYAIEEKNHSRVKLTLDSPKGKVFLRIWKPMEDESIDSISSFKSKLVRAGKMEHGSGEISPNWGWMSPTYGKKLPAISFSVVVRDKVPTKLISRWELQCTSC